VGSSATRGAAAHTTGPIEAGGSVSGHLLSQLRPVGGGDVFEEVLQRLMHLIKLGLAPPGSRLPPERELAASLGVSRQTLREVLRSLVQTGHLETRRGRAGGTFVQATRTEPSEPDARRVARAMGVELVNVLDLRWVVEPGAAALAARRADEEADRRLNESLDLLGAAPRRTVSAGARRRERDRVDGGGPDYRAADAQFHMLIGELTGSRAVFDVVADIQFRLTDLLSVTPQFTRVLRHSDAQHVAIVDAIRRRDPAEAERAMREHVESTAAFLEAFVA
jgi:DNA-binding FadR family transcriptional regulator